MNNSQHEHEVQNEEDDDLMDINRMSHMFGGKMFKEDMKSIEFREGVMFNNFIECAWALKNLCIQKSFRV